MVNYIKKVLKRMFFKSIKNKSNDSVKIYNYIKNGRIPWSEGYLEYKIKFINESLNSEILLNKFKSKKIEEFGLGLDERCVEYPWLFCRIPNEESLILDAGSTFNFSFIVNKNIIKNKELTIFTYYPENDCFHYKRISYVFGDLRKMCFKNEYFDIIVSQSTIEHIDMDNSIYGYSGIDFSESKSYEYLKAIKEMYRVLKYKGKILLTFPFGKYENHGFFQQFDREMLDSIYEYLNDKGSIEFTYFKYEKNGWRFADKEELYEVESFNPHTGKGKGNDGAAHSRGIACIEFIKN